MVVLDTGTNFPAVRVNSLLEAAMMKTRHCGKETGVPTQSQPHAASLTLSACNRSPFCHTYKQRINSQKEVRRALCSLPISLFPTYPSSDLKSRYFPSLFLAYFPYL
jgi:hypothetical protein